MLGYRFSLAGFSHVGENSYSGMFCAVRSGFGPVLHCGDRGGGGGGGRGGGVPPRIVYHVVVG